jgi:hypothetical protein
MDTYHIIRRLEWIKSALESGINCTDIAAEWGVSTKTAQSDINFLRSFYGLKIMYDQKRKHFVRKA